MVMPRNYSPEGSGNRPETKFESWFKAVEGNHKKGGEDIERDGVLTHGWGHKNHEGHDFSNFTQKDFDSLLVDDIKKAQGRARQQFTNLFGKHDVKLKNGDSYSTDYKLYDELPKDAQAILTDFSFNLGGIRGYPKMVTALADNDWLTVAKEYHRPQVGDRNELMFNHFIYPNLSPDEKIELGYPVEKVLINLFKGM